MRTSRIIEMIYLLLSNRQQKAQDIADHVETMIDAVSGKRIDRNEYPIIALREAILNALIHRDYSIHTQAMPIEVIMYKDRLEIKNPGGLYGRLTIDKLGKAQR